MPVDPATVPLAFVPAAAVRPLRHAVLRPGQPVATVTYAEDDDPAALHLAARDAAGAVVGCATFLPDARPGLDPAGATWRLRGMAVVPALQGQGLGRRLLDAGLEAARARGLRRVWCNGRTGARSFYERAGFRAVGDVFDLPGGGPHLVFEIDL